MNYICSFECNFIRTFFLLTLKPVYNLLRNDLRWESDSHIAGQEILAFVEIKVSVWDAVPTGAHVNAARTSV